MLTKLNAVLAAKHLTSLSDCEKIIIIVIYNSFACIWRDVEGEKSKLSAPDAFRIRYVHSWRERTAGMITTERANYVNSWSHARTEGSANESKNTENNIVEKHHPTIQSNHRIDLALIEWERERGKATDNNSAYVIESHVITLGCVETELQFCSRMGEYVLPATIQPDYV